jgi:hypothetical protein
MQKRKKGISAALLKRLRSRDFRVRWDAMDTLVAKHLSEWPDKVTKILVSMLGDQELGEQAAAVLVANTGANGLFPCIDILRREKTFTGEDKLVIKNAMSVVAHAENWLAGRVQTAGGAGANEVSKRDVKRAIDTLAGFVGGSADNGQLLCSDAAMYIYDHFTLWHEHRIEALVKCLHAPHLIGKKAALYGLAHFKEPFTVPAIREMASRETDPGLKTVAEHVADYVEGNAGMPATDFSEFRFGMAIEIK